AGPAVSETDVSPNPFTDYRFDVAFTHESGAPVYTVPGYFAADGNAANTAGKKGNIWRVHFVPEETGVWNYRVSFTRGPDAAIGGGGAPLAPFDGLVGQLTIAPTDKTGRDFRAHGRLGY